jgi:hypothetical protein
VPRRRHGGRAKKNGVVISSPAGFDPWAARGETEELASAVCYGSCQVTGCKIR